MIPAVQHDPPHNLKILTEKRNDEKLPIALLMVGGRGGGRGSLLIIFGRK